MPGQDFDTPSTTEIQVIINPKSIRFCGEYYVYIYRVVVPCVNVQHGMHIVARLASQRTWHACVATQQFFDDVWKPEKNEEERKRLFLEFMRKNVRQAKVDDSFFIAAGLAVPVAAVLGKRASGHIPYVKSVRLDLVPNVVFVPFVTLLGIVGATAWQMGNKSAAAKEDEEANEEEKKKTSKRAAEQQKEQSKAP